ncbi:DUF1801 domain-containing protein [uncultured Paraglaciecola sp.]|uniref:DUF1801 domain-containing protein n=1 Tax=uncultured Paraglaciecola sp. TaxID=1765024 RepID=UPI002622BA89|nr:DUF1801 domain-containing protein [uncultured Paraglaciecola sp.]
MEFNSAEVQQVFAQYPSPIKKCLLTIRKWVFEIAQQNEQIGELEECIKWDSPSYVTKQPKSGTTLRLSRPKSNATEYGLYVHCQTNLVAEFQVAYPHLKYNKNRGVLFDSDQPIATDVVKQFIYLALTYHCRK